MATYNIKRRKQQVEQCRAMYEIYRRHYGVVKSLSLTKQKVRETLTLSDEETAEIVDTMWKGHPRETTLEPIGFTQKSTY